MPEPGGRNFPSRAGRAAARPEVALQNAQDFELHLREWKRVEESVIEWKRRERKREESERERKSREWKRVEVAHLFDQRNHLHHVCVPRRALPVVHPVQLREVERRGAEESGRECK